MPQLLLIDVDGQQERNEKTMSLYNEKEIKALQRYGDSGFLIFLKSSKCFSTQNIIAYDQQH